jgi:hypothetical protein
MQHQAHRRIQLLYRPAAPGRTRIGSCQFGFIRMDKEYSGPGSYPYPYSLFPVRGVYIFSIITIE